MRHARGAEPGGSSPRLNVHSNARTNAEVEWKIVHWQKFEVIYPTVVKLHMDCAAGPRLGGRRRWIMDEDEQSELIRKLFYVLTGRLEDAAAIAAEGQGSELGDEFLMAHANYIHSTGREAAIITHAIKVLLGNSLRSIDICWVVYPKIINKY
jgi:hypothetical protein